MTVDGAGPAAPRAAAEDLFGARLPLAEEFAVALADRGVTLGLVGPCERDRLWERHILNCALITDLLPTGSTVADIGSGAGFPGVVIAIRRPDVQVTLIESMSRRTGWLESIVADLRLANVVVRRSRAEELAGVLTVDRVTARAVAPLRRLMFLAWPLCRPGGRILAFKGRRAEQEVAETLGWLRSRGADPVSIEELGDPVAPWSARVVVVGKPRGSAGARRRVPLVRPRPSRPKES